MGGCAAPRGVSKKVLIADDQPDVLVALDLLLKSEGWQTVPATSPAGVLAAVARHRLAAILLDLNYTRDTTSGQEGLDLLTELQATGQGVPVIVMTAWGSMELAVEAMRRGARDFVLKPWDNQALVGTLRSKIEEHARQEGMGAEARRLREDMAIARQVQHNLFPRHLKPVPALEYAGACHQAGAVGGDYYDFLDLDGARLGAVLADVSGKGISAALLMANLQATLRSQCSMSVAGLATLLRAVQKLYFESTEPHHFATLFFCAFDPATRRLSYVNCGHNPPILLRAGGEVERLGPTATVLGLLPDWTCAEEAVTLGPGDLLLVYSDGVTEAGRDREDEFGEERLVELLKELRGLAAPALVDRVIEAARAWGGPVQEDDLTVVALAGRQTGAAGATRRTA